MNAISPFSVLDNLNPGKIAGAALDFVADRAGDAADRVRSDRPEKLFSDIWDGLDVNSDGKLNGGDLAGHAVKAGLFTLDTVGRAMGMDLDRETAPGGAEVPASAPVSQPPRLDHAALPAQVMLSDSTAGRAIAAHNAISHGVDAIRDAYVALRAKR